MMNSNYHYKTVHNIMERKSTPAGFGTVTPCFKVKHPENFIKFLKNAFGAVDDAKELRNVKKSDGTISTAEVLIGNSIIMIFPEKDEDNIFTGTVSSHYIYTDDADAMYKKAIDAGATSIFEPIDRYWGDKVGGVKDEWNNTWWIATHIADISAEELQAKELENNE
jgi:uncharacterized glyoxalase superfamily protein PhnB